MVLLRFILLFIFTSTSIWAQKLIILHTNDHHGAFMANKNGEFGLAAQASMVKKVREQAAKDGDIVLVLSAGDINTGAPESNMFKARPDIEAMNAMGYDAMTLGNHEFDITAEELAEQKKIANFEFLAANIKHEDGTQAFEPYIVKEIQGKKIAIIGLTTAETPNMSPPLNRQGLKWEDPVDSQKALIRRLKKENDIVIALSHLGFVKDEKPGRKYAGDMTLAKANPDLDVIVGGHSHTELQKAVVVGQTSIFQAKESGQFLGRIEVDMSGPKPKVLNSRLMPVKNVIPDAKVASLLATYLKKANDVMGEKVGRLLAPLSGGRDFIKLEDSPLLNLAAQANKDAVNADIGISNARSQRTGLFEGDITIRDLRAVSPFNNTVTYVELDGKELWKTMEIFNQNYLQQSDQNIAFSKGFEIRLANGQVSEIRLNGEIIEKGSSRKFKLALGNFLSEMVDDFSYLRTHPSFVNSMIDETEAMAMLFRNRGSVSPKDLRFGAIKNLDLKVCNEHLVSP